MAIAIGFNEDLTTEILLRLPVKSIFRFKTVSKLWLSIASCPRFRQIHASFIGNATGLFFKKFPTLNYELEYLPVRLSSHISPNTFPFFDYSHKFSIHLISSSGGLLLLLSRPCKSINLQLRIDREYFVGNPTTDEFKHLAGNIPQLIKESMFVGETLAFDPSKSPHYKILFLCQCHEPGIESQIVIYSSETKEFSSPQATTFFNFRFCGIYCNDAIHWISYHKSSFYYFDLKTERMKESPLPPKLFSFSEYFGESRGHLHLVTVERTTLLTVHELKSDYSGWYVKHQLNLAIMAIWCPRSDMYSAIYNNECTTVFSILVDKEEEEENLVVVLLVYGIFVTCNFKMKQCIHLRDDAHFRMHASAYHHRDMMFGWPLAHQYIETLACV